MSADRGRLTYFPPRKYREVLSQQGRVLLEADTNEGQRIFTEEVRHDALDFVGPCGTPDNGYEVVSIGADLQINKGTMYVGGLRVTLGADEKYSSQPDWLDTGEVAPWAEGLWRAPASFLAKNVEATLVLREQEITAVEDPSLREVALGGPDTAARTRLLQRVVAADTPSATCAAAAGTVGAFWSAPGLVYDPATAALESRARLQVTPVADAAAPSPCDPPSASGYLGADNQMLRVQVTAFDAGTSTGTILWGYYNASTLYRATVQSATTLKLASRPVSAEYQPRSGQVVQVLSRAADLGEGAFAAALTGHFAKLSAPYAPDTQIVTLPGAMPMPQPPYANGTDVYLRLWEDQAAFTIGTAVVLPGTGLQVTITRSAAGPLHIGDFWCIAARPLTPNIVYPERLIAAPQPPDGPRMWACPLAVVTGNGAAFTVADDCRLPFDNLVELTARKSGDCACTVCVTPEAHKAGAPSLQKAIDTVIAAGGGTVCVEPGTYKIEEPLHIEKARSLAVVGKGIASMIVAGTAAFEIRDSEDVSLALLAIRCRGDKAGNAVLLRSSSNVRVERVEIENLTDNGTAIGLAGALSRITVRDNVIRAPLGIVDVPDPKTGGTGVVDLSVEDNQLTCDLTGIRLANVTVLQQLARISGNRVKGCRDAAIVVTGATVPGFGVEIIGNDLQVLGTGIKAGVDGLRIRNNDLFPVKDKANTGILLVPGVASAPLEDGQIAGNRISGFEFGITVEIGLGAFAICDNQISDTVVGLRLEGPTRQLGVDGNQMRAIAQSAFRLESTEGNIALRGNQLEIVRGAGIVIFCRGGHCLYADNCSSHRNPSGDRIELSARTLIVSSNRVLGKVDVALDTAKKKLCTVVGNMTGAAILLDGAPLTAPWVAINLQNV
jgi:hypothetical protein